jgi:hypothetical protein
MVFRKGQSGNPNGRPKNVNRKIAGKLNDSDRTNLTKYLVDKDLDSVLAFFCSRAETPADAYKFVKEFLPYLTPKLQSIKTEVKQDNEITISWLGFDKISLKPALDNRQTTMKLPKDKTNKKQSIEDVFSCSQAQAPIEAEFIELVEDTKS